MIGQGVKKGDRVGVFLKPSLETAIAIYGIMSSGAAYVPLDTNSPAIRITKIVRDCGIKHLVSNSSEKEKLRGILNEDLPLESVIGVGENLPIYSISWDDVWNMPEKEISVSFGENDLAYVMYTSGTTGLPKGIMHTHRSGLAYANLSKKLYEVKSDDILGNHSPLHFDISTMGYFAMPLAGATTVIIPEAFKNFPASLSRLFEKERLTIWYSVPLALIQMLEKGELENRNLELLRWVLFGGEPFPSKHIRRLVKLFPNATFSNVYGPAEINQCTFYNFSQSPENDEPIPLGKAWDETEIIIVDENDREVSKGETGELLVKTTTMMKGYWNQPKLTERAILIRSSTKNKKEIFYRTGDLARQNENEDLVFLGRKDRQIKLRGYRIELDEIESILSSHTNLSQAAVFISRSEADELVISAAVVEENSSELSEKILQDYLGKILPPYVRIRKIEFIEKLPRTAAGKIDHKRLERQAREKFNK